MLPIFLVFLLLEICAVASLLVVWAIEEGRACAKEVDDFLDGYSICRKCDIIINLFIIYTGGTVLVPPFFKFSKQ